MEQTIKSTEITNADQERINRFTRREFPLKDLYVFSVILCDNEVDRDGEAFTTEALEGLARLFIGKTGVFDHDARGMNQSARIFDTSVETVPGKMTQYGTPYRCLKARAYMVRNARCLDLITEIEAGIKKEVSIGCRMNRHVCSICGADETEGCGHRKGEIYNGKLCYIILDEPVDAYEWSFVAVPSQREAGVVKGFYPYEPSRYNAHEIVKNLGTSSFQREDAQQLKGYISYLEKAAELGQAYLDDLRHEVVRLNFLAGSLFDNQALTSVVQKMSHDELENFKKSFQNKIKEKEPNLQLSPVIYEDNGSDSEYKM